MKIKKIRIENFRPIKEVEVEFDDLVVLLGRNGSGKSSILRALDYFFDESKVGIEKSDFYFRNVDEPIIIRITFVDLLESERERFSLYHHNGEMTVEKEISCVGEKFIQKYYGFQYGIEELEEIKSISKASEKRDKYNAIVDNYEGLNKARSVKEVDENVASFYNGNKDLLDLVRSTFQFYGDTRIGGGSLDNFTKFVFIPAVREASEDLVSTKVILNVLISTLVKRKILRRKDINEFKRRIEEEVREKFSPKNLPELEELERRLTFSLQQFEPKADMTLSWAEPRTFEVDLPSVTANVVDDGYEGDIQRKGHGLQRSVIFTLLREMAVTEDERAEDVEIEKIESTDEPLESDLIICIEEPELYQHPLKCRFLSSVFKMLTEVEKDSGRNQIIYTTHSPYFVNLSDFNNILKVIKVFVGESLYSTKIYNYTIEDACDRVSAVRQKKPSSISEKELLKSAYSIMTLKVNEGFFADNVILVEGYSDAVAIEEVAKMANKDLSSLGIAVIPVCAKTSIDIPGVIFEGLGIQTFIVFDNDKKEDGTINEVDARRNENCLLLAGFPPESLPEQKVTSKYACFEGELEKYLERFLGSELFSEIRTMALKVTGARELNNPLAMSIFINEVYDKGKKLPMLEDIIEVVGKLSLIPEERKI